MSKNPLSKALRDMREAADLSGAEAARRAGLSQSKISRAETGRFMLSESDLLALCRVCGAPPEVREELVEMTRQFAAKNTSARTVLQRGGWWMQERIGRLETASQRVRSFAPGAIIGLLQSKGYIASLYGDSLPPDDLARAVQARIERQKILASDREFVLVMAEGALRWCMGSPTIMIAQLEHIAELTHRKNVRIGIIAQATPATVPAMHTFTIFDDTAVLIGTWAQTAIISDAENVAEYVGYWSELEPLASWDEDARAVINRVLLDYRMMA
jgi:transcriptional regulator with XRE-family HTH domain